MYVAKIIGTNVEVRSMDMLEAYNVLAEFAPVDAKISLKYEPTRRN